METSCVTARASHKSHWGKRAAAQAAGVPESTAMAAITGFALAVRAAMVIESRHCDG